MNLTDIEKLTKDYSDDAPGWRTASGIWKTRSKRSNASAARHQERRANDFENRRPEVRAGRKAARCL